MPRTFADDHPGEPGPRRPTPDSRDRLDPRRGLPRQPMFYTLDQVAAMLNLSYRDLAGSYVWFEGRDVGPYRRRYLRAVNLAVAVHDGSHRQEWRVAEGELLRWLTVNRLWIYEPDSAPENFDYDRGAPFRRSLRNDGPGNRIVINEAAIPSGVQMEDPDGG